MDGKFIDIAVGASTVWALGSNRDFYYRYTEPGSYKPFEEPRNRFQAWRAGTSNCVDGKFIDIAVGASTVWALGSNRDFYNRYTEPGSYKPFEEPRNRFQPSGPVQESY